jgi:hypothetical protein
MILNKKHTHKGLLALLGLIAALPGAGAAKASAVPVPGKKPTSVSRSAPVVDIHADQNILRLPGAQPQEEHVLRLPRRGGTAEIERKPFFHERKQEQVQEPQQTQEAKKTGGISRPQRKPAVFQAAPDITPAAASTSPVALAGDMQKSGISKFIGKIREGRRLSEDDAARYGHIFVFQDSGLFGKADEEIAKLGDYRLMGHVLYQRYISPYYTPTARELRDWMAHYGDHPHASRIYEIALKKDPAARLQPPVTGRGIPSFDDFDVGPSGTPYINTARLNAEQRNTVRAIQRQLSESPSGALKKLEGAASAFDAPTYDALRAEIAQSYFYNSRNDKAFELAAASSDRTPEVPLAGWIAGLSAWRDGEYAIAANYFTRAAKSPRASAWMTSAGAHWAARAYLRAHKPQQVSKWLAHAAQYPRTFYGIISLKILGMEQTRFNWETPELTGKHVKALSKIPAGRRALALVDAGYPQLARPCAARRQRLQDAQRRHVRRGIVSRRALVARQRRRPCRPRAGLCLHPSGIALRSFRRQ